MRLAAKPFQSPPDMLSWQYRSILEELGELQRHAADPTCPCTQADKGEYCLPKHALGLHVLAKETAAMDSHNRAWLTGLAEEALEQHHALRDRIVCGKQHRDERDTEEWARSWRKRVEPIYYACKVKLAQPAVLELAQRILGQQNNQSRKVYMASQSQVLDRNTEVPVIFHQQGTWGGRSFRAKLLWQDNKEALGIFDFMGTSLEYQPILRIDDISDNEGWAGLTLHPDAIVPGRFASGYTSPDGKLYGGKYFKGELSIGDTALDLKPFGLPKTVFDSPASYLHLEDETITLTPAQKELILAAIRFDLPHRFAAGRTLAEKFTRNELEGSKRGQIPYAQLGLTQPTVCQSLANVAADEDKAGDAYRGIAFAARNEGMGDVARRLLGIARMEDRHLATIRGLIDRNCQGGLALAAPAAAKEPWQMTWREYRTMLEDAAYEKVLEPSAPGHPPNLVSRLRMKVGDEGIFYRSGSLPPSGRSRNAVTGTLEDGVSVYPVPYASSLAGLSGRPWYMGKGRIIAIGSDSEPVIKPLGKWSKISKGDIEPSVVLWEAAVKRAISQGKPVPAEVLADYPELAAKAEMRDPILATIAAQICSTGACFANSPKLSCGGKS